MLLETRLTEASRIVQVPPDWQRLAAQQGSQDLQAQETVPIGLIRSSSLLAKSKQRRTFAISLCRRLSSTKSCSSWDPCVYPVGCAMFPPATMAECTHARRPAASGTASSSYLDSSPVLQAVQHEQAKTISIKSLNQQVSPFGFQKQQDGKPNEYGDSLFIGNLFERTFKCWTANAAEYEPRHIELEPCPLPADVREPTQQRLQAVTVVHCDGSRAPVKYGVALGWNATYGQLKEGIKKQCQIPEGQQVTLALLYRNLYTRQAHSIYMHVTGTGAMASST